MVDPLTEHHFQPFEVSAVHIIYVGFGLFVVLFASLSLFVKEKLYLGEAPIAAILGIIVGPVALGLFNPATWGAQPNVEAPGTEITDEITLELLRVTIALSVFAAGVELPKKYLLRHWRSIIILLGPVMIYGWLLTAAFIYALVPGLDFLNSLVVAAAVTPTDPILSASVVGGPWAEKHVPAHIRHLLMCESGCNDGAAFPFLYFALYWSANRSDVGFAMGRWVYETLLYEIVLGTILGALIGYVARKFIRLSERNKLVDRESFVAQYVSLALLSMGVNVLLGSDDLLAAFACGTAFAWDGWFTRQTEDSNFSSIVDLLFNVATFIYIGANMPFKEFTDAGGQLALWRLFVLAILTLLLKRIPVMLALWKYIPDIKTFRDALFVGHFGPIGCGAIFIATLGRTLLPQEVPNPPETSNDVLALTMLPITYFFVLCSIIVHGLTIPFFSFAKGAQKVTRTWSRHASFGPDGEPGWMTRAMRRTRTGESAMSMNDEDDGGGMSEIRRVLQAQLAGIGKGAIGGEDEKELRRGLEDEKVEGDETEEAQLESSPNESSSSSKTGFPVTATGATASSSRSADVDLEKGDAGEGDIGLHEEARSHSKEGKRRTRGRKTDDTDFDGAEEWHGGEEVHYDNDCSEWAGDDTCEMRKHRQAQEAQRRRKAIEERGRRQDEEERRRSKDTEEDVGEAPMDRDINKGRITSDDEDEDARVDKEGQAAAVSRERKQRRHKSREDEEEEEDGYPCVREWLEGNDLVLELQKSRCEEPIVEIIHLSDEERDAMEGHKSPAYKWVRDHEEELEHLVEGSVGKDWTLHNARHNLLHHGIPGKMEAAKHTLKTRTMKDALKQTAEGHDSGKEAMKEVKGHDLTPRSGSPKPHSAESSEPEQSGSTRAEEATSKNSEEAARKKTEEITPKKSEEETDSQREERAAVLYGALNWASERRDTHNTRPASVKITPTSAGDGSKPPPVRRNSSSTSPPRRSFSASSKSIQPRPVGQRRGSMRKKLLSGQIGLAGRRPSAVEADVDEEEEDDDAEAGPSTPATEPAPVKRTPKNFPRAASLGGLGTGREIEDEEVSSSASTPGGPGRGHHRSSSIQWLDVADGHDRTPATPISRRPRSIRIAEDEEAEDDGHDQSRHGGRRRGLAGFISSLRQGGRSRHEGSSLAVERTTDSPPSEQSSEGILRSGQQTPTAADYGTHTITINKTSSQE